MIQQSQRREWRRRRRRRNNIRVLLKILILILLLSGIVYGGKKLYDIYNTNSSKGNSTSKKSNTTGSANETGKAKNPDETEESQQPKPTDIANNPDATGKPNSSDKVDGADNPGTSDMSGEGNKPGSTDKSDEGNKAGTTNQSDEGNKTGSTGKSDEGNKAGTTNQSDERNKTDQSTGAKASDNQKGNGNSAKADDSYFDDAVFIGDSRTEGFGMYSGLKNTTVYSEKGVMVDNILKDKVVKMNGTKVTVIDALKSKSFGKVYIMLGVNELGWPYDDVFIDHYRDVIDAIKDVQPNAEICIQSIIHVSKEKDKNPPTYINNKIISKRNKLIKKMAEEENVIYLDLNPALTDSSGYLFSEASTDGVHLNQKYCLVWKDYLLEHTLN